MMKILLGRTPSCPLMEKSCAKSDCGSVTGLTNDPGNVIDRFRKPFLFMVHAMTGHHIVATAHEQDFLMSLAK
jgi:hypothetical protein